MPDSGVEGEPGGGETRRKPRYQKGPREGGEEARLTVGTLSTHKVQSLSPRRLQFLSIPCPITPAEGPEKGSVHFLPPQPIAPPRPCQDLAAASYLGHIVLHFVQVSVFEGPHEFLVRHSGRLAETQEDEETRGRQHLQANRAAARRAGAPPSAGGRSLAACRRLAGRSRSS